MKTKELKDFLDNRSDRYNKPGFIETDPISVPHRFTKKEDIEIAAFLTATIAWGQRKSIITNASKLMGLMDDAPFDFICHSHKNDLKGLEKFIHRTFNGEDCIYFIKALKHIYLQQAGLESFFCSVPASDNLVFHSILRLRNVFFSNPYPKRTEKHFSNPANGSAAKRINMFLRWMVRNDQCGVDFGIWHKVPPSSLRCPLDVHSGNVSRKLGLLTRKQNDWLAVEELTGALRKFDPADPVKYDFALFGLGVFEGF